MQTIGKYLKHPGVLIFGTCYIAAIVLVILRDTANAPVFIGMSGAMWLLVWLAFGLTEKIVVEQPAIRHPLWELLFGLVIVAIWDLVPLPTPGFGGKWHWGFILKKMVVLAIVPYLLLKVSGNSNEALGLTLRSWKKNLITGVLIFGAMAVPSAFYSGTASSILSGSLSVARLIAVLPVSIGYYFLMSGFSEEFLFRVVIQTRISSLLKSRLSGVLIASLFFGLLHIPNIMRWYPGTTLAQAYCRAFFIQTMLGVIMGTLWARTRSVIPGVFLHSAIDGLNNLDHIASLLGS